jgi:hypothetical protein
MFVIHSAARLEVDGPLSTCCGSFSFLTPVGSGSVVVDFSVCLARHEVTGLNSEIMSNWASELRVWPGRMLRMGAMK